MWLYCNRAIPNHCKHFSKTILLIQVKFNSLFFSSYLGIFFSSYLGIHTIIRSNQNKAKKLVKIKLSLVILVKSVLPILTGPAKIMDLGLQKFKY